MKLEQAIQIILDIARHPLADDYSNEDALEAANVVEDFFVNNVFDGTDEDLAEKDGYDDYVMSLIHRF